MCLTSTRPNGCGPKRSSYVCSPVDGSVMIALFLSCIARLRLTSPIDFLLTILPERLTPKCGFRCYTPRMASFFFSHGCHLTSCVTSYTAFSSSITQAIFPLMYIRLSLSAKNTAWSVRRVHTYTV